MTMKVLHALAKMYRCSEYGLSDSVLPESSLSCISWNTCILDDPYTRLTPLIFFNSSNSDILDIKSVQERMR